MATAGMKVSFTLHCSGLSRAGSRARAGVSRARGTGKWSDSSHYRGRAELLLLLAEKLHPSPAASVLLSTSLGRGVGELVMLHSSVRMVTEQRARCTFMGLEVPLRIQDAQ